MGAVMSVGLSLIGLGIGIVLGYSLAVRRFDAIRSEHVQRKSELRNYVLPILEQRASAVAVPPDRRARDVLDPLVATILIARAINEVEGRRDLPFTDTLEVHKDDITAEARRKHA